MGLSSRMGRSIPMYSMLWKSYQLACVLCWSNMDTLCAKHWLSLKGLGQSYNVNMEENKCQNDYAWNLWWKSFSKSMTVLVISVYSYFWWIDTKNGSNSIDATDVHEYKCKDEGGIHCCCEFFFGERNLLLTDIVSQITDNSGTYYQEKTPENNISNAWFA